MGQNLKWNTSQTSDTDQNKKGWGISHAEHATVASKSHTASLVKLQKKRGEKCTHLCRGAAAYWSLLWGALPCAPAHLTAAFSAPTLAAHSATAQTQRICIRGHIKQQQRQQHTKFLFLSQHTARRRNIFQRKRAAWVSERERKWYFQPAFCSVHRGAKVSPGCTAHERARPRRRRIKY